MGFRFLLDSGLHVADAVTEAPAAPSRDVDSESDDAAPGPLVTAEGRLAATWAENPDAARALQEQRAPLVWLC